MKRFHRYVFQTLLCCAAVFSVQPLQAQVSRADSAAVLLEATRRLELEGETSAARELLDLIVRHFPGTQAAVEAEEMLSVSQATETDRSGRASLIAFSTLYGAWLGVAVPAALGANEPEPFGAGLLVGAPLGFFGSKAFVGKFPMSSGQATLTGFGARWGTWQGIGWREVFNIGDRSEEAPFTAAIVGGVTGLISTAIIAQKINPAHGSATMVEHGAWWGVWYGVAGGIVANADEDDATLTWALVGGNVGLVASALATRTWKMGAGRTRIISAAGLAGGVVGLGLDLVMDVDDEETAVLIPAITSVLGLVAGGLMTQGFDSGTPSPDERSIIGPGLINVHSGNWNLGFPAPQPTAIVRPSRRSGTTSSIGMKFSLFSAKF